MGASAPKPDYSQNAYSNAYNAAKQGQPWGVVQKSLAPRDQKYMPALEAGYNAGRPPEPQGGGFEWPEFEMPTFDNTDFEMRLASMQQEQANARAQAAADAEAARAAAERATRDRYMNMARANVANRLGADKSRTALLGMEYKAPDIKSPEYQKMVDDEFKKLYGTQSQSLIGKSYDQTTASNQTGRKSLITGANAKLADEDELSIKTALGV